MGRLETVFMSSDKEKNLDNIVDQYSKRLLGFIRGKVNSEEDANDILQDVWFQLSNILYSQPIEQVGAWLFRVARNRIIDKYRKKKTESIEDYVFEDEGEVRFSSIFPSEGFSPEVEQLQEMFWEEFFNALNELPEKQKQVFVWNELEDKTLQEIADDTGENIKTIISRKGYAVKHLRNRLQSLYDEFLNY